MTTYNAQYRQQIHAAAKTHIEYMLKKIVIEMKINSERSRCDRALLNGTPPDQYQSSSMSIAIVPSGPSAAWIVPTPAPAPTALPANRLRLRIYSLCLRCFFALISTSLSRLALFAPAYERLAAVPMLDRTRSVLAALPALALAGIFEPPPTAERESDDAEGMVDDDDAAAAARCAPSLAMMREREIRGLRA
jgi:hypothetical protein